jgi:DNA-directed RNA polymerase subunit RPC12/RpoP
VSVIAPENIVCVDCGGTCHLLSHPPPDEEFEPGDVVAYRCSDCNDRWDVELADPDDD